ncbi:GTPase kras-like protein [Chytriomyces sp. MP71]|nr:GTPase kras-like protein [Chytriomyces sp. MP71]
MVAPASSASEFRIVLLGAGAVGKSAIAVQFMRNEFPKTYEPTIEDSFRKQLAIDGQECRLDVLDTAGQEEYVAMRESHILSGEAFLIVYSVGSRASFAEAMSIHRQILKTKQVHPNHQSGARVPIVLVANKCDMPGAVVTSQEGLDLAKEFQCPLVETSAKMNVNIGDCFTLLVREAKRYRNYVNDKNARIMRRQQEQLQSAKVSGSCLIM